MCPPQEWREGVLVVVSMAAIFLLAVIIVGVKVKRDQRSQAKRNQQINLTIIDMNLDLPLFKCIAHCCLETDANGSAMSLSTTNFVVEVACDIWKLFVEVPWFISDKRFRDYHIQIVDILTRSHDVMNHTELVSWEGERVKDAAMTARAFTQTTRRLTFAYINITICADISKTF